MPSSNELQLLLLVGSLFALGFANESIEPRIQPYSENPRYWQYKGVPNLLLGASNNDNLFQDSDLELQLDLLAETGGNFVRNTMSSQDAGNPWPFSDQDGIYDLNQWNPQFWERFERLLELARDRNIVVQVEIWAFHEFFNDIWDRNPWNPQNNLNYSFQQTRLKRSYGDASKAGHDFFKTVPRLQNDAVVLQYQERFLDKLLSISLKYENVLYCMTNEIHPQFSPEWGWYWSNYIRGEAEANGKAVETTEMFWTPDLKSLQHRASLDHPEIYSFLESSQNSALSDELNWDNLMFFYGSLTGHPRPINSTKIYGADTGPEWAGSTQDATERFWRNILGGVAASRFHRPPVGLGLTRSAQMNLRSARLLLSRFNIFQAVPDTDSQLILERERNEAYLSYIEGEQYALFFPSGGSVKLDLSNIPGEFQISWLDILNARWLDETNGVGGVELPLATALHGPCVALVTRRHMEFSSLIPQFVSGPGFASTLVLKGRPGSNPLKGLIRYFGDDGLALELPIKGLQDTPVLAFSLEPSELETFRSRLTSELRTGYLLITADAPFDSFVFLEIDGNGIVTVPERHGETELILPLFFDAGAQINSALAFVNPSPTPTAVHIEIRGRGSKPVFEQATFLLPAGGRLSKFVSEMFPIEAEKSFEGVLNATCATPITAFGLLIGPSTMAALPLWDKPRQE